jgi:hypothetical protein
MTNDKKKKIAVVRCDTHAYWFGAFMEECDVKALGTYHDDAPKRASIHNYFKDGNDYTKLKIKRVEGFTISKVFDRLFENGADSNGNPILQYATYPERALKYCETFKNHPTVCETIEEATIDVDAAYIADSNSPGDGADHLELARPFLEKSIPCFVDKPFTSTLADAKEIIRLAQENNTTVMSASILSYCDEGLQFKRRFDEIGGEGMLIVKGLGPANGAVIHGLGLAHGLFGYGVESVHCTGSHSLECIELCYPDGRKVFVLNPNIEFFPKSCTFYCSAYNKLGAIHAKPIGDPEFYTGTRRIVKLFKKMLDTGKPSVPYQQMLEPIAIMEAARIAQKEGKAVFLKDLLEG